MKMKPTRLSRRTKTHLLHKCTAILGKVDCSSPTEQTQKLRAYLFGKISPLHFLVSMNSETPINESVHHIHHPTVHNQKCRTLVLLSH